MEGCRDQDCHFVNDKPSSAVEFVQQKLGGPSISDYEKLKAEKLDLQLKYDKLLETHKETCRQFKLLLQLCKGVGFVHGRGVLHKTMALKIADLGLSRAITVPVNKYTHEILTLWYRAPDVLLGATHYSTPVDICKSKGILAAQTSKSTELAAFLA
ncbi:CBP60G (CAM-BINDING PROTEIN 60-LIKE.G) [Zea mays]|uniref:CBP60G (CAM-BINDING PROTEIN 60-LIKE.G) n=1 Tax=Zea mays TaxID=4577 RepID=A0A1D6IB91_MAIZE|nr:CBP60G (CAM-BINDING PROTEIN 60-LIKE.G) [Zea mays]